MIIEMLLLAVANLGRWLTEWAERRLAAWRNPRVLVEEIKETWL